MDPFAGLLLDLKGDFPALHEVLTYGDYRLEVLGMDARRILKIKVIVVPVESLPVVEAKKEP